jgi:hypothetical protein
VVFFIQTVIINCEITFQVFENDVKDFSGSKLSDIQKQSNALLKDCSDADKKRLQNVMQGME